MGILNKIKGYAGTSAGSIIAALLAIGYTPGQMTDIMFGLNMLDMADGSTSYFREGVNFVKYYGMVPGKFAHEFLGKIIEEKTGSADYTIEQLYLEKGIKLVIVGTDMNMSKSRYFYPDNPIESDRKISIRQAVRISVGIPFLFEPVLHQNNYHVDGGVLDNYPIHVFDGDFPGDRKAITNMCVPNPKVLGLHIVMEDDVKNDRIDIDCVFHYSMSFIHTFMAENNRRSITKTNAHRTIQIVTPNYPVASFVINDENKKLLIDIGQHATEDFFNSE